MFAIVKNWIEHSKSLLITDKGFKVRHVIGREVIDDETRLSYFIVDDKGNLSKEGAVNPHFGQLSPLLVDVTEDLRVEWFIKELSEDEANPYEERQQARRDRYLDRAEHAKAEGNAAYQRANGMLEEIPLGQPILVGHHSERRHRSTLEKVDNLYRKAFKECDGKAKHYEHKAASVGHGGISGDDPEATRKLIEKLQRHIKLQEKMKACNKIIKKSNDIEKKVSQLMALELTEMESRELLSPDFCGRIGFASYQLQNNNAEIARLKKRIAELETVRESAKDLTEEYEGFKFVIDSTENRVMFIFDGKPNENIRRILKSHAFKWSPRREAWVRKITGNALFDAKYTKSELLAFDSPSA